MARQVRPRALAAVFGAFFLVMALFSWNFSQGLTDVWYRADLSRWVYMAYLLAGAILLSGVGAIGLSRMRVIDERLRELEARISEGGDVGDVAGGSDELPPPLPETIATKDTVDQDIDELLVSLSEMEETAEHAEEVVEEAVEASREGGSLARSEDRGLMAERARVKRARKSLTSYIAGPALTAIAVLAIAGAMLPASDGMLQSNYQLNTALILGIGYAWAGIGGYVAATVYALLKQE